MDRLSDLPDFIIHHIISYLGTEEACRSTILSKRWAHIWSTGFILEFKPEFFSPKIDGDCLEELSIVDGTSIIDDIYSEETMERLMNFIESTMRRYSEKNLSIRKFTLEYPIIYQEMARRFDRWIGIALRNQVEELSLSVIPENLPSYALPAILFSAKSLTSIKLCWVRIPYSENLKLISLQSLDLLQVDVDEHMLYDIIKSCPLKFLKLEWCSGFTNISIPSCSKLESLHVVGNKGIVPLDRRILVDTSTIRCLTYKGDEEDDLPLIIFTPNSKKNLKKLRIFSVVFSEESFSKLVSELPSIEIMSFFGCVMPKNIRIASQTLTELGLHDYCYDLVNVALEAPKLHSFCYNGDLQLSSVINSHSNYNAYLHLIIDELDTRAWLRIKKLLSNSNGCCKILSIILSDATEPTETTEIEFNKDQLSEIHDEPLYDLQELKLSLTCSTSVPEESSCKALIDGLLWCCRPDILSLSINLPSDNNVIRTLLDILQKKVKYWKHPLKRIEIEGTNSSSIFFSWDLDLRLRLYW
ncbi:putative F-box/LRR-repeat protein At3g18150 [Silene latifolia]|uniref:putative F-box/LRR-repeat protein At3g18150 n=1 Tax=Silene latifolia TaxID=37657 RepID=UPI003D76B3FC